MSRERQREEAQSSVKSMALRATAGFMLLMAKSCCCHAAHISSRSNILHKTSSCIFTDRGGRLKGGDAAFQGRRKIQMHLWDLMKRRKEVSKMLHQVFSDSFWMKMIILKIHQQLLKVDPSQEYCTFYVLLQTFSFQTVWDTASSYMGFWVM